ncbi:MAG: hypothetical protein AB1566_09470 [Chloroflexota bacterium]
MHRPQVQSVPMLMTIIVWLCTLPLIGIFVWPFFGLQVALTSAAGLFIVMMAACYALCAWPKDVPWGE